MSNKVLAKTREGKVCCFMCLTPDNLRMPGADICFDAGV